MMVTGPSPVPGAHSWGVRKDHPVPEGFVLEPVRLNKRDIVTHWSSRWKQREEPKGMNCQVIERAPLRPMILLLRQDSPWIGVLTSGQKGDELNKRALFA